jgi:putative hydrolase
MFENYELIYDHHTHTIYSHGKGDISDNVKVANDKGLKEIAITDHGPGHHFYGLDKNKLPEMREKIQKLKTEFPKVNVLLGVEANIVDGGNYLDITMEEFKDYDMVIAGYHYGVSKGHVFNNYISSHIGFPSGSINALRIINTNMTVGAIYENNLEIITHPGDKGYFDIDEIAKACVDNDTMIEINNKHRHLTAEEIKIAAKYDVKFVVSSDAHRPEFVGSIDGCLMRACEAGLDFDRIVNIRKKYE